MNMPFIIILINRRWVGEEEGVQRFEAALGT